MTTETTPAPTVATRTVEFCLEGGLDIPTSWRPIHDYRGLVVGFRRPDGTELRPQLAFEIHNPAAETEDAEYRDISHDDEFQTEGLQGLDYSASYFHDDDYDGTDETDADPAVP